MSNIVILVIEVICAIVIGVLAGHAVVFIFNRLPAKWLCDYGEEPSDELKDTSVQRIKGYPWKLVCSGVYVAGAIHLVFWDWQFCIAAMVFSWALTLIAIADRKYSIIPDQLVILAAFSAMGFIPFQESFREPIFGVLLGAGVMLASAIIGKLLFKKEALGFGDVKLFAAIGLVAGLKGTLLILVLSSLTSAAVFSVKLIRRKIKREDMIPLGPYICGAAIFYVVIIWPLL